MPRAKAEGLLASGLIPESECQCNACLLSQSVEERLGRAAEHNLAMLVRDQLALADVPVHDRIVALRATVARARAISRRLRTRVPFFSDRMEHLRVIETALDEVERAALLSPGRAALRAG